MHPLKMRFAVESVAGNLNEGMATGAGFPDVGFEILKGSSGEGEGGKGGGFPGRMVGLKLFSY